MTIDSVTVGGVVDSDANGFHIEDMSINRGLSDRPSTAELVAHPRDGTFEPSTLDEIEIRATSPTGLFFGGWVTGIEKERIGPSHLAYRIRAADWSMRLKAATTGTVTPFVNRSDVEILQAVAALVSGELGGIQFTSATMTVVQLDIPMYDASNKTLDTILREVSGVSGAEYYISASKHLYWFNPVYYVAPIALSDTTGNRLNYVAQSERIDGSDWTALNVTVVADVPQRPALVPLNTADRLYETSANGQHRVSQDVPIDSPGTYTLSAYVLGSSSVGGRTACFMAFGPCNGRFDLANQVASEGGSGAAGIGIEDASETGGNPWRRCWIACDLSASDIANDVHVRIGTLASYGGFSSFAGDATLGIILTGVQIRKGSSPGSYRRSVDGTEEGQPFVARTWTEDHSEPANRVTVVGGNDSAGDEVLATVSDSASIASYGAWHRKLVDRTIEDAVTAALRGQVELERNALPAVSAQIVTEADGLAPGATVLVSNPIRGFRYDPLTVRSVRQEQLGMSDTRYTVDLGPPVRDVERLLQLLAWRAQHESPGSIDLTAGQGQDGEDGRSTFPIYSRDDPPPALGTGGSFDSSGSYVPPSGWSLADPGGSGRLSVAFVTVTPD